MATIFGWTATGRGVAEEPQNYWVRGNLQVDGELSFGGNILRGIVHTAEVTFTETTGAGVFTGSVNVPAGATLLEVAVHATAVWNSQTSATGKVGDVADDDGIFTGIDMIATDLTIGQSISAAGGTGTSGGKEGADIIATHWNRRYLATARVISLIITKVGSSGTLGRTRLTVTWSLPQAAYIAAATKV